jgi:DNA mismatch repair protein MLH1
MSESQSSTTLNVLRSSSRTAIRVLPAAVVDRIAAGEVVQRASAAVKEMCENSLDAGSTQIRVTVQAGTETFAVADNGCGIDNDNLPLACQRHATSKLTSVDDLQTIQSFGFRGEALASMSMVGRVHIVSKTAHRPAAYQQQYENGAPAASCLDPTPTARTAGTTVTVSDLFYNLPHRRRMRASDEYQSILKTVQWYAIHYAKKGVAMHCQYKTKTDLNTAGAVSVIASTATTTAIDETQQQQQQHQATKNVIAQIFGSQLLPHLIPVSTTCYESEDVELEEKKDDGEVKDGDAGAISSSFCKQIYSCTGFVTSPSYHQAVLNKNKLKKNCSFILFVNNRLVDGCAPIRRCCEQVYVDFCKEKPPLLYLALTVPPDQVDVNVHPTKRDVALLHLDRICHHLADHLRVTLQGENQVFAASSVVVVPDTGKNKRKVESGSASTSTAAPSKAKKSMVRTSRSTQSGTIEPFLVSTQLSQSSSESPQSTPSVPSRVHRDDCPLRTVSLSLSSNSSPIDLSIPGAFATVAAQCTCNRVATITSSDMVRLSRQTALTAAAGRSQKLRLQRLQPTKCSYTSVKQLRKRVVKHRSKDLEKKLRRACFVGVVSHDRCLIQCGEDLILMNQYECFRELFYQLALNGFRGGCRLAKFATGSDGSALDIQALIEQCVQLEEDMLHENDPSKLSLPLKVSETNQEFARQAAMCLHQHADMLLEYFSIDIKKDLDENIVLTGLPVLLEGFEPSPHGLPLFLLRLATEVNWSEEKPCFHTISRELGSFYAQLPSNVSSDEHLAAVRHTVFPAVSTLFVPSHHNQSTDFATVTSLPKLYRVFERC